MNYEYANYETKFMIKLVAQAALASTRLKNYFYLIHIYFSLCIHFAIYSFNLYFSLRLWHIINSMGANDSHTILHIYLVCMII